MTKGRAMRFRELREDEIECRVSRVTNAGVELLLYKTARVDADILDETVGAENWQCQFYDCKGTLFCRVGILCEHRLTDADGTHVTTDWVWKDDAGSESNIEAKKGEASDAFKRACFRWGIGRALYSAPEIFVYADKCRKLQPGKNGKMQCFDRFKVAKIGYEDGAITGVRIVNEDTGQVAFSWKKEGASAGERG